MDLSQPSEVALNLHQLSHGLSDVLTLREKAAHEGDLCVVPLVLLDEETIYDLKRKGI